MVTFILQIAKFVALVDQLFNYCLFTVRLIKTFFLVSAFYFECPEKDIYMNASIWTKSKFMGMSIGVVMVGKSELIFLC